MRKADATFRGPLARGLVVLALLAGLAACANSGQPTGASPEAAAVDERSHSADILKRLKGPNYRRGNHGR